ncbi:MAG: PilZ domain-containing protein, partial [Holophaga sp.]|nr:PilZ domain-containing protein [Holophaga sp.]
MGQQSIRNADAVRDALRVACERGEMLILLTPYVRNESSFLRLDQDAVHVVASIGREDAIAGLRSSQLLMRFPYGFTFLEGATDLLGVGRVNGRPSLKLAIPEMLSDEDYRGAYRVERLGRTPITFSTRKYDILSGHVVNVSTTGLRFQSMQDFEELEMLVEDTIMLTLTLETDIHVNQKAKIRYVQGRSVGVEFRPALEGELLANLSRWVFRKREEFRDRATKKENCQDFLASASSNSEVQGIKGLVLVSAAGLLEDRVRALLGDLAFTRVDPTIQGMKSLVRNRTLVLLHAPSLGLDDRRRIKVLAESLGDGFPILLLGTGLENSE